jgi:VanZ family protein
MTLKPAAKGHPKPPLSTRQQRFWLTHLLVAVVVGAVVAVAIFKPESSIQTAIFTVLGTGFLGPLKDAFRTFFPGGKPDDQPTD